MVKQTTDKNIIIFTDGASKGNPGPGGYAAIIVFIKNNNGGNPKSQTLNSKNVEVCEIGGRKKNTTNNRMELAAAIEALSLIQNSKFKNPTIKIYTDSSYLINGITKWIHAWQKNYWQTKDKESVLNKDLWQKLLKLSKKFSIEWKHVKGHSGTLGNERADEIASTFAEGEKPKLFSGAISEYKAGLVGSLNDFLSPKTSSSVTNGARSRAKAYSYLSMIDGVIKKHQTWAGCEKRVKGKSGAKFRKALSAKEEKEIIKKWES